MSDLAFILQRAEAGDRVRFFHDYYGRQWVELTRGWILTHKTRVDLTPQQVQELKARLRAGRARQPEAAGAYDGAPRRSKG